MKFNPSTGFRIDGERSRTINVPHEIKTIAKTLAGAGYQAYLVGGCVRDLLLKELGLSRVEGPKDWDIATDAKPEETQKLFPESVYENQFGTVLVKLGPLIDADKRTDKHGHISVNQFTPLDNLSNGVGQRESAPLKVVEITTFRLEGKYTDKRHPDAVRFAKTIEEDLSRRDFTVNALALSVVEGMAGDIVDPYGGREDLKKKIIRAVGDPPRRFEEDALRLMRAVRFAVELGFAVEKVTAEAIHDHAGLLEVIAKERIRDELMRMLMAPRAAEGIVMLEDLGLLRFVLPELREGIGCAQNRHHTYTVFDHNVRALNYAVEKRYPLAVRLASLLHDAGKPRAKRGEGPDATFHGHEVAGARMAAKMLDRLRFPQALTEEVIHLIRCHMFYYNVGEVSAAGVRRFLARVGVENVDNILRVREADRIGSDVPKAFPYKLRHLLFMIEKVRHDPLHPKMLKVRGDDVMKLLGIPAGPRVGYILSVLLEEVIDDPKRNTAKYLEPRVTELGKLDDKGLAALARKARDKAEEFEAGVEEEMKQRHHVQ
ncbi:MAG: HD domain-containing protein [Candidatus Jorgensenbacteria bacterium]